MDIYSSIKPKYIINAKDNDLVPIDHIAKVMLNRSANMLNDYEKRTLVNEYYSLLNMVKDGHIKLAIV